MLKNMVASFSNYQKEQGFRNDLEAMMDWAQKFDVSGIEDDLIGKIRNEGLATIQNLRMCLGIDTVSAR